MTFDYPHLYRIIDILWWAGFRAGEESKGFQDRMEKLHWYLNKRAKRSAQ